MGRYGASEVMINKDLQKKAVNYGMKKLSLFIQDTVGLAMDHPPKLDLIKNIKLIDQNWMEKVLIFTNG